jgi:hypothetical protein
VDKPLVIWDHFINKDALKIFKECEECGCESVSVLSEAKAMRFEGSRE